MSKRSAKANSDINLLKETQTEVKSALHSSVGGYQAADGPSLGRSALRLHTCYPLPNEFLGALRLFEEK